VSAIENERIAWRNLVSPIDVVAWRHFGIDVAVEVLVDGMSAGRSHAAKHGE